MHRFGTNQKVCAIRKLRYVCGVSTLQARCEATDRTVVTVVAFDFFEKLKDVKMVCRGAGPWHCGVE